MDNIEGKRISLKRRVPNPVFQGWLEKLHEEAKAKNNKLEPMLREALNSLSNHPLPLETGAACFILKGFDRKLCYFLDQCLAAYHSEPAAKRRNGDPATDPCSSISSNSRNSPQCSLNSETETNRDGGGSSSNSTVSNKSKVRKYTPAFRSGSYAILVALLEHSKENLHQPYLFKDKLMERAQMYSEESFTRPKPETFYTAWSSMSGLLKKELVKKKFRMKKAQYSLTQQGLLLATELLKDTTNRPTANDIIFNGASTFSNNEQTEAGNKGLKANEIVGDQVVVPQRTLSEIAYIDLPAGSFDIILLIDKQETSGVSNKNDPTVAQFAKYPDLKCEYRSLKVGDFTWIARHRANKEQELVLPYIVERKRMDDLGSSIKDGRFHEQKFRLRKCGLQNVIYLVENFGSNLHVGLPIQSLMQALANTRVQDGYKVHRTDSLTDSVKFLAMLTKRLTMEYKDKLLIGCNGESEGEELMTFNFFNKSSMKNKPLTVTETFIKLLLQLKGVSVEKALAITRAYSTPRLLMKKYEKCTVKQGETLLATLKYSDFTQNVGPKISKAVYQLLTKNQ